MPVPAGCLWPVTFLRMRVADGLKPRLTALTYRFLAES